MQRRRDIVIAITAAALAFAVVLPVPGAAAPVTVARTQQQVAVTLDLATPAVATGGALDAAVTVTLTEPARRLEVSMRVLTPTGGVLYQRTDVRTRLDAGGHIVTFNHALSDERVKPGRYPIEVRVRATGADPVAVADRLLVYDAEARPVPLAVVMLVSAAPATDAWGRFTSDPGTATGTRDDIELLGRIARSPSMPVWLAVPPLLIDDLARAARGYETAAGASVAADDPTPIAYAQAIGSLRSAVESGGLRLLVVPYALPDLAGADADTAERLLADHLATGVAARTEILGSAHEAPAAYLGRDPIPVVLEAASRLGLPPVLVPPAAVRAGEDSGPAGWYALPSVGAEVLCWDADLTAASFGDERAIADALFDRIGTDEPAILVIESAGGYERGVARVARVLDTVARLPWVRAADLESAAVDAGRAAELAASGTVSTPADRIAVLGRAATLSAAYAAAAPEGDPEAAMMGRSALLAASSLWPASPDAWDEDGIARVMAEATVSTIESRFDSVRVEAKDVTLAGSAGDLPLTMISSAPVPLTLNIDITGENIAVKEPAMIVVVQPGTTFLTIPVDLERQRQGRLRITVSAGSVTVSEGDITVTASYLDRLATVGMVLLVLIGLLVFIRRRVQRALAATITETGADERTSVTDPSEGSCAP